LLSLVHAAFFGIGAYATGLGMTTFDMGFGTPLLIGADINIVGVFIDLYIL